MYIYIYRYECIAYGDIKHIHLPPIKSPIPPSPSPLSTNNTINSPIPRSSALSNSDNYNNFLKIRDKLFIEFFNLKDAQLAYQGLLGRKYAERPLNGISF